VRRATRWRSATIEASEVWVFVEPSPEGGSLERQVRIEQPTAVDAQLVAWRVSLRGLAALPVCRAGKHAGQSRCIRETADLCRDKF
jgi:hypothetical protein